MRKKFELPDCNYERGHEIWGTWFRQHMLKRLKCINFQTGKDETKSLIAFFAHV